MYLVINMSTVYFLGQVLPLRGGEGATKTATVVYNGFWIGTEFSGRILGSKHL